jgi:hypothetical protein
MTESESTPTDLVAALHELRAENDALRARLDALVEEHEGSGPRPAPVEPRPDPDPEPATSRRHLLKLAGAGAAGAVGATLGAVILDAAPAAAGVGTMQYGTSNNPGSSETDLTGSALPYVVGIHGVDTSGNGTVVRIDDNTGFSGGTGVLFDGLDVFLSCRGDAVNVANSGTGGGVNSSVGSAGAGTAVSGFSFNGIGVYGSSVHGVAVQADITLSFNGAPAILATTAGHGGEAVSAAISNATNPSNGIDVTTAGTGSAFSAQITNGSNTAPAAFVSTPGTGYALWAQQLSGTDVAAIYGDSNLSGGPGVVGSTSGPGAPGVQGEAFDGPGVQGESASGPGVQGLITSASSNANAVEGITQGTGCGLFGQINNASSSQSAIIGLTNGTGAALSGVSSGSGAGVGALVFGGTGSALLASIVNGANTQPAVAAVTNGTGPALQGKGGTKARGAVLSGGPAQAQLTPSTASTHPTAGQAGDLFVDSALRLWFCTVGGTTATWKQVQMS